MNGGHGPVNYEPKDVPDLSGNPAAPFILGTQPHVYMPNQAMANRQGYTYQAVYQPAVTLSSSDPSTSVPNEYDAHAAQIAAVAAALPPRKGAPNMAAAPVMRSEQPVSPSVYPASSDVSAPSSGNATITISPRREQDAGFLQGDELEPPTLPPDYDAATLRRRAGQP
ncbi:hypothetical protein DACRYDRAFT_22118 [Dacryopinax primogenitus]|uniref:Uncharacterized protein n=1 Tax=Dacryopinax primogenitus (strain DJM 731) TaxID=1858805 RepID=M5FWX8_DACPD|nr:uncharacterized protein DACRYDRAFT_22118 [Dacryopinax primogenitus]EJU02496.1 hypothetical protein DACRYDRAFT_22118 [Dacryopinax primogenitus]